MSVSSWVTGQLIEVVFLPLDDSSKKTIAAKADASEVTVVVMQEEKLGIDWWNEVVEM